MKKYLTFFVSFILAAYSGFTQLQATIKLKPAAPNTVVVAIKSTTTLTATTFSSFQLAVGIPAALSTGLTASIVSLDGPMVFVPTAVISNEMQNGVNYTVYAFNGDGAQGGAGTTYTAGVERDYAEVTFAGGNLTIADVRIMQLPGGGANGQNNFYVADKGADVVNQAAQFYSTVPTSVSNDGNGYNGSSWATIGPVVLPVKFLGFNVSKKNNDAVLTWQIENETSITDHYEVEKSVNGVDFVKMTSITPKNNGNSSNTYDFTDGNLFSTRSGGVVYYRIKQIDKDGKFIITPIRNLRLDSKSMAVSVYPNPIQDNATISLDLVQDEKVVLTINDAAGKQIRNISYTLFKGLNIKKINMSGFASGNYMLKVTAGSELKTIPLVKAK